MIKKDEVRCPHCGKIMSRWEYFAAKDIEYTADEFYAYAKYCCSHCVTCFTARVHYKMQYQDHFIVGSE